MKLLQQFLFSLSLVSGLAFPNAFPGDQDLDNSTSLLAPRAANLLGFDISASRTKSFFTCMRNNGYKKVVIRAYIQGCARGGEVDSAFLTSYNNAKAAGFSAPNDIDAYMFPCTGTQASHACKPIQTQINELLDMIKKNKVLVHRLWLDVEPTRTPKDPCNAWNLSPSANLNLAKQWTAALRKTGLKWGIYGNPGQWTGMFPSKSSDIGSDLPLWVVIDDNKSGVSSVSQGQLMGGWKLSNVHGKQFLLDTTACSGSIDKDSFTD